MDMTVTALVLLYLVPVALLALLLASTDARPRWLVVTLICCLPLFYSAHYLLLDGLQGYPSKADLPAAFELVGFVVEEPRPASNATGHILIWAHEVDTDKPRVHRLDYSRDLHEALGDAGERMAAGTAQYGKRTTASGSAGGETKTATNDYRFTSEPPRTLPPKPAADD